MDATQIARRVVDRLLDSTQFYDRPPPRYQTSDDYDTERITASRSAFTAYDHAINVDRKAHPATWRAVKGSPYEKLYRQELGVPVGEN